MARRNVLVECCDWVELSRLGSRLFNPLAPALDKDDQHNDRKDSSNDSNNSYIVHAYSPF